MATGAPLFTPPPAGRLLDDRYQLSALIGRGGMASVYAATDIWLQRPVAVKLFRPYANETTMTRLKAEGRLLAGLSHPGLLRVYDISTTDGQPYLVMELIDGYTLRRLIDRRPLPPDTVAGLGVRLAETLDYVHSRHIVHRDIKPSNVLLDDDGSCYLSDFGIAKAIGDARLTASGHCAGTAAYLAPEQVAGTEIGAPADVYALGLVLLECLTGEPEYTGSDVEAALARLTRSPRMPEHLPPAWRETLARMTARDPGDRPDAGRCAELLWATTITTRRPTGPVTTQLEAAPRPARRWHAVSVPAAVLGLATIALGVLLWATGPEPASSVSETGTPPAAPPVAPSTAPVTLAPAPLGSAEGNVGNVVVPPAAQRIPPKPLTAAPGTNVDTGRPAGVESDNQNKGKGKAKGGKSK